MENNNLNALRILYIVKGIISILTGAIFLLFMGIGSSALTQQDLPQNEMPFNPAVMISGIGIFLFIVIGTLGVLNLFVAKFIKEKRNHGFIFAIAVLNCLTGVLGLALGIFTLIEIQKAEVKQLFLGNTI